jgi:hypothetical protein
MAGMRMSDVNPLVGADAARQGRCQQVKEDLQVKQVTVADVDVRSSSATNLRPVSVWQRSRTCRRFSQCILRRILITTVNSH